MIDHRRATRRSGRPLPILLLGAGVALASFAGEPARADYYDGLTAYESQDFPKAVSELLPLAETGDRRAQKLVGLMYRDGQGVPQDFVRAHMWLNLAAAAGDAEAATARDELSDRMDTGQIAEAQRLASVWQPESAAAPTAAPIASTAVAPTALPAAPAVDARPLNRAQVTDVQWQLAVHGYDPGPADGVVGARTRGAILQYQADATLPADGEPTLALLDHLQFTDPPVRNARPAADVATALLPADPLRPRASATASYGSAASSADLASVPASDDLMRIYTVTVQQALAAKGYRPGPADGVAGARTREAIRRYQTDYHLPVTGEVSLALVNHLRLISGYPVGYPASEI